MTTPPQHQHYSKRSDIPFDQLHLIGKGSNGSVDKVEGIHHPFKGRIFARKQILIESPTQDREAELRRIQNEVDILGCLRHPHIVDLEATYLFGNSYAIIMSPCAQQNLDQYLLASAELSIADLERNSQWFRCLISGMSYIHEHRIQHRDIKPNNILVDNGNILFTDFGISSMSVGIKKTLTTEIGNPRARTPEYCAPEVEEGHSRDQAADIFSLGAVILEILSTYFNVKTLVELRSLIQAGGHMSYARNVPQVVEWIGNLSQKSQRFSMWKLDLLDMCRKMLHENPGERPSAADLRLWFSCHPKSNLPPSRCKCDSGPGATPEAALEVVQQQCDTDIHEDLRIQYTKGHWFTAGHLKQAGAKISLREELLAVAEGGLKFIVEDFLQGKRGPIDRCGVIQRAARGGSETVIQLLLETGGDVDEKDNEGRTALVEAISNRHKGVVSQLLENGANVNLVSGDGESPLCKAADTGSADLIEQLLLYEADVNMRGKDGVTALCKAAEIGDEKIAGLLLKEIPQDTPLALEIAVEYGHMGVVRLLLEVYSDPDTAAKHAQMLLPKAVKYEHRHILRLLLEKGADINDQNLRGSTVLYEAAKSGHTETMEVLISLGANINAQNGTLRTPLHAAIEGRHDTSVKFLLDKGARHDINDRDGMNAFDFAIALTNLTAVRMILQQDQRGLDDKRHSFDSEELEYKMARILRRYWDVIEKGLEDVVDVFSEISPEISQNLLRLLVAQGQEESLLSLVSGSGQEGVGIKVFTPTMMTNVIPEALEYDAGHSGCRMLHLILNQGADPNTVFDGKDTVLLAASSFGINELISLLLEYGADVNMEDSDGRTALHEVSIHGHVLPAETLLRNGADVHKKDQEGWTPLHLAAYHGHGEVAQLLIYNKASLDAKNEDRQEALALAAGEGHEGMVQILLNQGANPNPREPGTKLKLEDTAGAAGLFGNESPPFLPLQLAASGGHVATARLLLKHGADVNISDHLKITPLHLASDSGHINIVQLFLEHNADVDAADFAKETALHKAAARGYAGVVRMLLDNGANCNPKNIDIAKYLIERDDMEEPRLLRWRRWWRLYLIGQRDWIWEDRISKNELGGNMIPLHMAAAAGREETVQVLLKGGADIYAKDRRKRTALDMAEAKGHTEVVRILRESGAMDGGWQRLRRTLGMALEPNK